MGKVEENKKQKKKHALSDRVQTVYGKRLRQDNHLGYRK